MIEYKIALAVLSFLLVFFACAAGFYRYDLLAKNARLARAEEFVALVEELTDGQCNAVEFCQENDDGIGPNNHLVSLSNEYTNYEQRQFYSNTRLEALRRARDWLRDYQAYVNAPNPFDPS